MECSFKNSHVEYSCHSRSATWITQKYYTRIRAWTPICLPVSFFLVICLFYFLPFFSFPVRLSVTCHHYHCVEIHCCVFIFYISPIFRPVSHNVRVFSRNLWMFYKFSTKRRQMVSVTAASYWFTVRFLLVHVVHSLRCCNKKGINTRLIDAR